MGATLSLKAKLHHDISRFKFVAGALVFAHPELGQHFNAGLDHHRRHAEVELDGFGI